MPRSHLRGLPDHVAVEGLHVGVPRRYFFDRMQAEVRRLVEAAISRMESAGARVREVALKHMAGTAVIAGEITVAEAMAYHSRWFEKRSSEYGRDLRVRMKESWGMRAVPYLLALRRREEYRQAFLESLEPVDGRMIYIDMNANGRRDKRETVTEAWLSLIDNQNYAASWDAAATLFRTRVTQEQWQTAAQTARAPLGQLKSRTLKSATSTTTLPGAPDGEYVVFQFTTSFEQKAAAVETVTAVREMDGKWHVGGYFIK